MMNERTHDRSNPRGFTLIELLMVISIMVILAAMVIPRVRVITADRKISEAGRVVRSMLTTARDDAVVNGFAAVEFVRNPNYTNGVTSMFRMRMLPPYAGDLIGDSATVTSYVADLSDPQNPKQIGTLSFSTPPSPSLLIGENDYIQFNHRGALYRMQSPTTFEVISLAQIQPPMSVAMPFKILRKPKRITSSEVRLPGGQLIDLRLSGDSDVSGSAGSLYGMLNPTPLPSPNNNSFVVTFDRHGAIDRYYPQGLGGPSLLPSSPLFLLVSADEDAEGVDPLQNMNNMWVVTNPTNGGVTTTRMSSNSPQTAPFFPATPARLNAARALATQHREAQQQ
jgi:prepilin-type N-terminal cleavage/methylation domain-containing protein